MKGGLAQTAGGQVELSEGIAPPTGLQNRACHVSGTRLLKGAGSCHEYLSCWSALCVRLAVYLVVTVTVNRGQVGVRVGPVLLAPVMDLQ